MKIDLLTSFSVTTIEDINKAAEAFNFLLIDGEIIEKAYTHVRDKVIFTNKRIICMDVQGFTGSKKEYRIFPYAKITSFSIETSGFLDGDSDFKIWVSGVGVFEIKFHKKLDIKDLGIYLSKYII